MSTARPIVHLYGSLDDLFVSPRPPSRSCQDTTSQQSTSGVSYFACCSGASDNNRAFARKRTYKRAVMFVICSIVITAIFVSIFYAVEHSHGDGDNNSVTPSPLQQVQSTFVAVTQTWQQQMLKQLQVPVLLASTDNLTLLEYDLLHETWQTTWAKTRFLPASYQSLRLVSHIPVTVLGLLAQGNLHAIRDFLDKVQGVRGALTLQNFDSLEQLWRQQFILNLTVTFLQHVTETTSTTSLVPASYFMFLRNFTLGVGPLLDENTNDAARGQVDALLAAMRQLNTTITSQVWQRLVVIVQGRNLVERRGSLLVGFFEDLLNSTQSQQQRVLFTDGTTASHQDLLTLLSTRLLLAFTGEAFFADVSHLMQDPLGPGAAARLAELYAQGELPARRTFHGCPFFSRLSKSAT